MSQDETKSTVPYLDTTPKDLIGDEQLRLAAKLYNDAQFMTQQYKALIQHTGGLVTSSMVYAYSKGIQDAIKLILKENDKNGKTEVSNPENT